MKVVFYRTLLKKARNITPTEKIIYSFLVSKSITRMDCVFESDGDKINLEELIFQIKENNYHCDICDVNHSKLATELHMTRTTIINGMKHLRELGYIGDDWVYINIELIKHGYFVLEKGERLTGELLIFYSYLCDKSANYDYIIDTFKNKLALELNKSKIAITKLLNRLYEKKLAKRLSDGKLQIYY